MRNRRTYLAFAIAMMIAFAPIWRIAAEAADVCSSPTPANLSFTLKDMNGKDVSLGAYKGKVILLNFWATWCGPCKVEMPGFVELYTKYQSQGLVVLGVSVDDPVAKLKPFATQMKINYPILVGNRRDDVKKAYPLFGLPNTFAIGRDGNVCTKHAGFATKEQLEPIIKALL